MPVYPIEEIKKKMLYVSDRKDWRKWLEENFKTKDEIWLVYPNKASGKPRITYNDAVEEALCFGWIDSIIKKIDHESSIQRFSPRNPKSSYSQPNKERVKWLLGKKMVHPSLIEPLQKIVSDEFVFPVDIIEQIKNDKTAWANYQNFSEPYKRIRIAYINSARIRPEEFAKRLNNFLAKTRENKMFGFGGIEKYY